MFRDFDKKIRALVEAHDVGDTLAIVISRNEQNFDIEVILGERRF